MLLFVSGAGELLFTLQTAVFKTVAPSLLLLLLTITTITQKQSPCAAESSRSVRCIYLHIFEYLSSGLGDSMTEEMMLALAKIFVKRLHTAIKKINTSC